MKKIWDALGKLIRHQLGLSFMLVVMIGVLLWVGCESTTPSLKDPGAKVTRGQLILEYETEIAAIEGKMVNIGKKFELAEQDLDKQDQLKAGLVQMGSVIAEGGTLNYTGLIPLILSGLGIGAMADNVTKNRIIAANKKESVKPSTGSG